MLDYKLHTFLALCQTMNYRLAAESLNMTQPAVTRHIQQLEAAYGCKLFRYKSRQLHKTEQAHKLERYARSAEYHAAQVKESLAQQARRRLHIGATRTIGDYMLTPKVAALLQREPTLELHYSIDNTGRLLRELDRGRLDFAFIEGFLDKEAYEHQTFAGQALVGICAKSHPFAGQTLPLEALFNSRLLLREPGSGTREALEHILREHNVTAARFLGLLQCNSFGALTGLVASGAGLSFVYEAVATASEGVAPFFLEGAKRQHSFSCVYLKNTQEPPFLSYFLQRFAE